VQILHDIKAAFRSQFDVDQHDIWLQPVVTAKRLNRIRRDTDHIHVVVGVQHPTGCVEENGAGVNDQAPHG
jgi:hypothetical protein